MITTKNGTVNDACETSCRALLSIRSALMTIIAADPSQELEGDDLEAAEATIAAAHVEAQAAFDTSFRALWLTSELIGDEYSPKASPYAAAPKSDGCADAIDEAAGLAYEAYEGMAFASKAFFGLDGFANVAAMLDDASNHAWEAFSILSELYDAMTGGDDGDDGGPQPQPSRVTGGGSDGTSKPSGDSGSCGSDGGGDAEPSTQEAWRLAITNQEANERPLIPMDDEDEDDDEDDDYDGPSL